MISIKTFATAVAILVACTSGTAYSAEPNWKVKSGDACARIEAYSFELCKSDISPDGGYQCYLTLLRESDCLVDTNSPKHGRKHFVRLPKAMGTKS